MRAALSTAMLILLITSSSWADTTAHRTEPKISIQCTEIEGHGTIEALIGGSDLRLKTFSFKRFYQGQFMDETTAFNVNAGWGVHRIIFNTTAPGIWANEIFSVSRALLKRPVGTELKKSASFKVTEFDGDWEYTQIYRFDCKRTK